MSTLTFQEAIAYAESRGVVLPDEYYGKLAGVQRAQAVSIAGLGSLEQIKFILDLVAEAMRTGSSMADFQKKVAANTLDIELPKHRLDNIFRTNVQVAYNRGRWEQQSRVTSTRPYLMYDAINDSRTRPTHLEMDGTILPHDHPWWSSHYPPCGYRCRCRAISLTEAQAQKRGGVTGKPPEVEPDEGWDFNPGLDYGGGVKKGLEDFGKDLPYTSATSLARAKAKIQEEANMRQSQKPEGLVKKQQ